MFRIFVLQLFERRQRWGSMLCVQSCLLCCIVCVYTSICLREWCLLCGSRGWFPCKLWYECVCVCVCVCVRACVWCYLVIVSRRSREGRGGRVESSRWT